MFIRQTSTRNNLSGESYTTYRLVRSERVAGKVKQVTLGIREKLSIQDGDEAPERRGARRAHSLLCNRRATKPFGMHRRTDCVLSFS